MSAASSTKKDEQKMRKSGPREGSVVWAMIQVLDGKRKAMTPVEILAEIQKRGLANKLAGKTPEASVAARLSVHVGIYFERPEKGKYQLKKGITANSIASGDGSGSKPATSPRGKLSGSKGRRKTASRGRKQSPEPTPAQPQQQPAANTADDTSTAAPAAAETAPTA